MFAVSNGSAHASSGPDRPVYRESQAAEGQERPVTVVDTPRVFGPFAVENDPSAVEYEVVAKLHLPAPDAEVTPTVSFNEASEGSGYVDVQWTTPDRRAPEGIYERAAVVTLPRQFAVASYTVTGEAPLMERELGA